jgi:hypothetical protein
VQTNPFSIFAYVAAFACTKVERYCDCRACDQIERTGDIDADYGDHTCNLHNVETSCLIDYLTGLGWSFAQAMGTLMTWDDAGMPP